MKETDDDELGLHSIVCQRWPTVNLSFWESGSDLLDFGAHHGSGNIPNPEFVQISMKLKNY
jgi:hypothetical protein